ncbi:MAG: ATP-binding cassette domain-containing protein [Bacteroidetes bacterium]|nr:ATP-binding cassette domain-containing protein [Bacteroidota bacterium]
MNPVLELDQVSLSYQGKPVLADCSMSLQTGDFCYLLGPTGSGKSSILKLFYRAVKPTKGDVKLHGETIQTLPNRKTPYIRRQIGVVFQDFQLLQDRNVFENIAFALRVTDTPSSKIEDRVKHLLDLVGLSHKKKESVHVLSGGEQQRISIARALANAPDVLLADEPTGNLDPGASTTIMELLHQINREQNVTTLMVTHDHSLVKRYPGKRLELKDGTLYDPSITPTQRLSSI